MSSTLLRGLPDSLPICADPAATMGGGTPLIVAIARSKQGEDYHVLVRLQLLQAYERVIFELQQQLLRYKVLIEQLAPKPVEEHEWPHTEPMALNAASVRMLDSVLRPPRSTRPLLGYEEPEDV